jgi:NAD+ kinase
MLKKISIVVKNSGGRGQPAAYTLKAWLEAKGCTVEIFENVIETVDWYKHPGGFPRDRDLIVVLGGDGTLLSAARYVQETHIPILGVNLGKVGFITEISLDQLYSMMELILEGKYECEERLMLTGGVFRDSREVYRAQALNDVVLNKGTPLARITDIHTRVNGEFLNVFRADGLIISTPTGSTAYNLAAGGPILHPSLRSIVLTPICPFMLTNRPIILPGESTIDIEIGAGAEDVTITYDGQAGFNLIPGDVVRVEKAEGGICLIKSPFKNYFEMLRTKLKWGEP